VLVPSHYYQQTCGRPDLLETSRSRNKITRPSLLYPSHSLGHVFIFKDDVCIVNRFLKLRLHSRVEYIHSQMQNSLNIQGSNHSDGEKFAVTSIYTQHVGSNVRSQRNKQGFLNIYLP